MPMFNAFAGPARTGWMNVMKTTTSSGTVPLSILGPMGKELAREGWGKLGLGGKGAMIGAVAGSLYGGFSDNGSVLGGALKGAALGFGVGRFGIPAGVAARKGWNAAWGMGLFGRTAYAGRAAVRDLRFTGMFSARQIGNTARRGYNTFSTLGRGIMSSYRRGFAGI